MHKGSCLCGGVTFEVMGELSAPDACHCQQCRKQSGHYWASCDVPSDLLSVKGEEHLTWYLSSEKVRRGFCKICGSFLFWDPIHHPFIAVAMGAFDTPSQTQLHQHIFTANKGDYYSIADGLPQIEN